MNKAWTTKDCMWDPSPDGQGWHEESKNCKLRECVKFIPTNWVKSQHIHRPVASRSIDFFDNDIGLKFTYENGKVDFRIVFGGLMSSWGGECSDYRTALLAAAAKLTHLGLGFINLPEE